jgi:hypothetical protein
VLIHLEVQSQEETAFARRMYTYNHRLFDRYDQHVVSLAILGDERASWRPAEFAQELWGCAVSFRFPIVKLVDFQNPAHRADLEESASPFATVVLAHLAALETRQDMARRGQTKVALTRRLYARGYSRQDIVELYRPIDWLLALPAELEEWAWQEISQLEEERQMAYITSAERIGRRIGREEGLREGLLAGIELALTVKFGDAGQQVVAEIQQITDLAVLQAVPDHIKTATTLDELRLSYRGSDD